MPQRDGFENAKKMMKEDVARRKEKIKQAEQAVKETNARQKEKIRQAEQAVKESTARRKEKIKQAGKTAKENTSARIAEISGEIDHLEQKGQEIGSEVTVSLVERRYPDIDENMLKIRRERKQEELTFFLSGRLDTQTSPLLEDELKASLGGIKKLFLDLAELALITSAGLRVLLSAQKVMNRQGEMKVLHPSDDVMEVIQITGFTDFLTIE